MKIIKSQLVAVALATPAMAHAAEGTRASSAVVPALVGVFVAVGTVLLVTHTNNRKK